MNDIKEFKPPCTLKVLSVQVLRNTIRLITDEGIYELRNKLFHSYKSWARSVNSRVLPSLVEFGLEDDRYYATLLDDNGGYIAGNTVIKNLMSGNRENALQTILKYGFMQQ